MNLQFTPGSSFSGGENEAHFARKLTDVGKDVGKMWGRRGEDVGKMWGRCGEDVEKDMGKIWGRYGEDMGKMWGRCGEDVGKMCQDVGKGYGEDAGKIEKRKIAKSFVDEDLAIIIELNSYPEPGSNRHGLPHWCLRPARLPIPPSGHDAKR